MVPALAQWSRQRIAELAPNDLILGKARVLAQARAWKTTAYGRGLIWGQCKSSGERVYQVAIDLDQQRLRCTCQERYHPCRHALALLLYYTSLKIVDEVATTPPAWVAELLDTPAPTLPTVEGIAQQKREQRLKQRIAPMQQGVSDLEQWLLDLVRQGLAAAAVQEAAFFGSFASKMVDQKLGGVARRIRQWPELLVATDGFERLLEEVSALYLFVQAFKQIGALDEPRQSDLLRIAGVNPKKEEVLSSGQQVSDIWLVVGVTEKEEDGLRSRKHYLIGQESGKVGLLLEFAWKRAPFEHQWAAGSAWKGTVVFYPGSFPLRVLVQRVQPYTSTLPPLKSHANLSGFSTAYAHALAANPWIGAFPGLINGVSATRQGREVWVVDSDGQGLPSVTEGLLGWKLLAACQGKAVMVFGEWNGRSFYPLAIVSDGRVRPLLAASPVNLEDV